MCNVITGDCTCLFHTNMWLPCVHLLTAMRLQSFLGRMCTFNNLPVLGPVPVKERWLCDYNAIHFTVVRHPVEVGRPTKIQVMVTKIRDVLTNLHDVTIVTKRFLKHRSILWICCAIVSKICLSQPPPGTKSSQDGNQKTVNC